MNEQSQWVKCNRCGKKLLKVLNDGSLEFVYGRMKDGKGKLGKRTPVRMKIYGVVKIVCISNGCDCITEANPFRYQSGTDPEQTL